MKIQITNSMLMALIINLVFAKAIGLTQGIMAREVGSDIWVSSMLSTFQGMGLMALTVWIIRRLPDKNIIEQVNILFGKWIGRLAALVIFVFFSGAYAAIMITFVYHLMDYFLPGFPVYVFVLVAMVIPVYAIYHGLEVTARIAVVGVFSMIALNLLVLIGTIKDMDITRLMPVLESGPWRTVWASRHNDTDWAMATMMTAMILPLVKDKTTWMNAGPGGIFYGGMLVVMWSVLECGVLSAPETGHYIVACMQLARSAEIGVFIHRYEMIMIAFFGISLLVQLMISMFCACLAISQTIGLKDYKPTVIPVAIVLGGGSYWVVMDHTRAMGFLSDEWVLVALPVAIGLPAVVGLTGLLFPGKLKAAAKRAETPQSAS